MVGAETGAQAVDAAEMVEVDYDPLPVVIDPERAAAGAPYVHDGAGTNLVRSVGEVDDSILDGCEVVVRQRIVNRRVAASPLETRAAAARWSADGALTYWISTQGVHPVRDLLAGALGMEPAAVRDIAPDVGGGFGTKVRLRPGAPRVVPAPRTAGRPRPWSESRTAAMANGHGRAQVQHVAVAG